jgi:hypothetical protein
VIDAAGEVALESSGPAHVRWEGIGFQHAKTRLLDEHPGREIVGWWHTHPFMAPFFSEEDRREQAKWPKPRHVGLVLGGGGELLALYHGPHAYELHEVLLDRSRPVEASEVRRVATVQLLPPEGPPTGRSGRGRPASYPIARIEPPFPATWLSRCSAIALGILKSGWKRIAARAEANESTFKYESPRASDDQLEAKATELSCPHCGTALRLTIRLTGRPYGHG